MYKYFTKKDKYYRKKKAKLLIFFLIFDHLNEIVFKLFRIMSDEEEVQYAKKVKTIHYGSLEDSERARLEAQEEDSNDSEKQTTNEPQVQEPTGKPKYFFNP